MFLIIMIILEQVLLHLPLMVGAYISFSLLKIPDLSIESAYVTGAIFGMQLLGLISIPLPLRLPLILFASLFGGAMVGVVSSLITRFGRLPHLLSTIITFGLFHGFAQLVSPVYVTLAHYQNPLVLAHCLPKHPEFCALVVIGLFLLIFFRFLFRTQLGYAFAVYGNNPHFFENYGISTSYIFVFGILLANAMAGLSGYLFAQSNSFLELNMGLGKALLCITALILGKTVVKNNHVISLMVPLFGTVIYFAIQQTLLKIGFNLKYFTAVQAIVILVLLLYRYRESNGLLITDNLGI